MATIDERLDRLTERHEALVQYSELTAIEHREKIGAIVNQMGTLITVVTQLSSSIGRLETTVHELASVAHNHENRIEHLEGQ